MAFVVYKSSAGSGKTATLVLEYLRLCLKNPNDFKRTLAITFTNKAANEMKSRIIDTLMLISEGKDNFIADILKLELGFDDDEFRIRAANLLNLITHNYDEFSVSTIDSFVHKIIRTFSNDLNLPANFEIVLDKDDIIPDILDELYRKIGHDKNITDIILKFVFSQIEDEKTHNISSILSEFIEYNLSEEIFSQRKYLKKLTLDDFIQIVNSINIRHNLLKTNLQDNAKKAINLLSNVDLGESDLAFGSGGIYGYLYRLQNITKQTTILPGKRPIDAVVNEKCLPKKASESVKSAFESIKSEFYEIFSDIRSVASEYVLIHLIKTKIYSVALVAEIQNLFTDFTDRTAKVHISDFNKKISDNIEGQPVPYIYERLGFKFKHFLIDEFQDTSVLQWNNLLPLVEESLSNYNFSMLVGDAKQAIYRFRNGEVELFSELPKLYNKEDNIVNTARENLLISQYSEKVLDFNYRSGKTIVEFNNKYFRELLQQESEEIARHYKKLEQKTVNEHKSFVKIELLDSESNDEFFENKLIKIESYIKQCINKGYSPEDICVLSRTGKTISALANFLINHNYEVVSSESLLVSNSPKVSMIESLLNMIAKPGEKIFLADFLIKYAELNKDNSVEKLLENLNEPVIETYIEVFQMFNSKVDIRELLSYSVYEICEFALRLLNFTRESDIFLQFFLDFVYKAQNAGKYTLLEFLDFWEEKKSRIYVSTPDNKNAIKLMTAHKSKGLAFKVVIVDLNDGTPPQGNTIWADVSSLNIPLLERTLIPLNSTSAEIGFEKDYEKEKLKEKLDLLNLMYVCFTRASHALFAISSTSKRNKFGNYLSTFVSANSDNESKFERGELKFESDANTVDDRLSAVNISYFPSVDLNTIVKISPSEDVNWNDIESRSPESYGTLIHKILSEIETEDDIEIVIDKYIDSGLILLAEREKVVELVQKVVLHPKISDYFKNNALIKNETDIYSGDGKLLRPDRVVMVENKVVIIDYKTGTKLNEHKQQILKYIDLLKSFGYDEIEAYLVYTGYEFEIEEVL